MSFSYSLLGSNGRIGNQLFQIACTISTALSHGDTFSFPAWSFEKHFNLHDCFEMSTITQVYKESDFHYSNIEISNSKDKVVDLQGFFQSEKYFLAHCRAIKFALTPVDLQKTSIGKAGIHVRRGDYLKFSESHPPLGMDYYTAAMNKIKVKKYVVFSDDIEWCKDNFKGKKFEFSENKTEIEDLIYMTSMEHNIIANSSFSWWAAYLNPNPNKIVIAPETWFGPALKNHDTKDLYPQEWIKL